jgi:hypothetical protein
VIEGHQIATRFGRTVAGVGDLNGDQYDDVAIGATLYDDGQTDEGAVFVYYGGPDGIVATGPDDADAELQGDQLDTADPLLSREHFGYAIAAGDWDGDGHRDLLVSSPYYDAGQTDEGAAFVFRGSATGIASAGAGAASRRLESNVANAWLGSSVALVDVNGDGKAEAFVGGSRMGYPFSGPDPQGSEGMVLGYPLVTACENGLDDDGDGATDLADTGCTDADDQREEVDYATGNTRTVTTAVADTLLSHDLGNGAPTTVVLGAGGSTTADFVAIDHSIARLDGGTVAGDLVADDAGSAEILAGSVAGSVVANGSALVAIHGGSVVAMEANDTSMIQVYGYGFALPAGAVAATSGTIQGHLEDGSPIAAAYTRAAGATIELVDVPEPGAAALAAVAAGALALQRRRRAESRAR